MKTGVAERFGAVIRDLRESRGWSQERLAADAAINRSYIGEIERARAIPTLATAEKIARALGLPLSTLIARSELPTADHVASSPEQLLEEMEPHTRST